MYRWYIGKMACICCSDSLKDLNPRKYSECITNLDSTICHDCLPELFHINCGDCSSSSDSSSDAKYSCNLFLQCCEIFEQPKVNCRIKHADLVFIASKIGWKDNLQELKDTLREGMFMVTRIRDLFSSLSRLVSLNNTFRQTIGTFFNTNLLHTNLISDIRYFCIIFRMPNDVQPNTLLCVMWSTTYWQHWLLIFATLNMISILLLEKWKKYLVPHGSTHCKKNTSIIPCSLTCAIPMSERNSKTK